MTSETEMIDSATAAVSTSKDRLLTPRDLNSVNGAQSPTSTTKTPAKIPNHSGVEQSPFTSTKTPTTNRSFAIRTPASTARSEAVAAAVASGKKQTPGRGLFSPCLPLQQRQLGRSERRKKFFDKVCPMRVGEDIDDSLYDQCGIEEWSVDDFEYVGKLGSGGMALVYLAYEKQSGHRVALKIQHATDSAFCEADLHKDISSTRNDTKIEDRDESGTTNSGIVHMIDYFYTNELIGPSEEEVPGEPEDDYAEAYLYSILEVCDGGDLHDAIDFHGELPESLAAKYMMQAIESLEELHGQNIIHCDIKPSNFLVPNEDGDDGIKLADFGMAVRFTEKEVVGGSPVYMAPEHLMAWRHHSDDFDHRCDIYSLGIVMYELLMGYLPYDVNEARDSKGRLISGPVSTKSLDNGTDGQFSDDDIDLDELDLGFPVLDLRNLKDSTCKEPIVIPPPVFIEDVSEEAEHLIYRFLDPDRDARITLAEAKKHPWFQKHL